MRILVTVGTTKFDKLIQYVDQHFRDSDYQFILQIAGGAYKPANFPCFTFTNEIETYYQNCDMVICHAGAGSIFPLLELRKKIIVVPNLERRDKHQLDIARFMSKENYVLAVFDFDELDSAINKCKSHQFKLFKKQEFSAANEILDFLMQESGIEN